MIAEIKEILYATDLSPNSAYVFRYALFFRKRGRKGFTAHYPTRYIIPLPKGKTDVTLREI